MQRRKSEKVEGAYAYQSAGEGHPIEPGRLAGDEIRRRGDGIDGLSLLSVWMEFFYIFNLS
jgi:hypothetical protein